MVAFSDIRYFSKMAVFKDFGGCFKIPATGTIFGPETKFFFYLSDRYRYFWGPSLFGLSPKFFGPYDVNSNLW